jgi:DNA-3-methyladenine glycosylase
VGRTRLIAAVAAGTSDEATVLTKDRGTGGARLRPLLAGPVLEVAPALLGWSVRSADVVVRLTEVEAYDGQGLDPGSHAHRGRTPRNAVMFGPPGHAYVYFTYGMHWCLNVVTGPAEVATAVLLRAGEVVHGLPAARARRPSARSDTQLAQGPARLAAALGVDGSFNTLDLLDAHSPLRLLQGPTPGRATSVRRGPRVGLSRAGDLPWRFWLEGEPTVSRYRSGGRRGRAPESRA